MIDVHSSSRSYVNCVAFHPPNRPSAPSLFPTSTCVLSLSKIFNDITHLYPQRFPCMILSMSQDSDISASTSATRLNKSTLQAFISIHFQHFNPYIPYLILHTNSSMKDFDIPAHSVQADYQSLPKCLAYVIKYPPLFLGILPARFYSIQFVHIKYIRKPSQPNAYTKIR